MTIQSTASKGLRIGNEAYLTGSEILNTSLGESVNAIITAATDDQAVVIGAFTKADLAGLVFIMDQDGLVRMRGPSPFVIQNIVALGDLVLGDGGTFTILNDQTAWIYPGDQFWIEGCTTAANDGLYYVVSVGFAAGVTTIECFRRIGVINAAVFESFDTVEAGAGAATLATKLLGRSTLRYIDAGDDFTVAGPPGQIVVGEDLSFLQAHDKILIQESTTPAVNDGIFNVVTAVYVAPDTTITVEEAVNVEAGNGNCSLTWVRSELMCRLVANVPHLWTWPSGILNPVLEDITTLEVSNSHATADADFQARILKVPV